MARKRRQFSETGVYHVILRGINKKDIFKHNDDKMVFLKLLSKNFAKFHGEIYAFCIMSNHVHLLVREGEKGISNLFQRIAGAYAIYFNRKYARSGPLFESRFKSKAVENIYYFFQVVRYIHQNPYHAGIVKKLEDYNWSSFSTYLHPEDKNNFNFVNTNFVYTYMMMDDFVNFNLQYSGVAAMKKLTSLWPIRIADNTLYQIAQKFLAQFGESLELKTTKILDKLVQYLMQISGTTKAQIARLLNLSRFQINKIISDAC